MVSFLNKTHTMKTLETAVSIYGQMTVVDELMDHLEYDNDSWDSSGGDDETCTPGKTAQSLNNAEAKLAELIGSTGLQNESLDEFIRYGRWFYWRDEEYEYDEILDMLYNAKLCCDD